MSPSSLLPRRLLLLAGDESDGERRILDQLPDGARGGVLWVAERAPPGVVGTAPGKVGQRLGGDCRLLVVNAHQGFHPDAFAAAVGMLRGGGDCILLTPPADAWPGFPDPDRRRFAAYPRAASDMPGHFIAHLLRCWLPHPGCVRVGPDAPLRLRIAPGAAGGFVLNAQQREALAAIERVALGHARRPLVLTADRGRGKSTVLGMAAARLLAQGLPRVTVVAPHRAAAATLYQHALADAGPARRVVGDTEVGGGVLQFRLPVQCRDDAEEDLGLVLVDEAAAIPVTVLAALLGRSNRLVFATTVHGYEGSGRGFELRFRPYLDRWMPQWHALRLGAPVRWAPDDPLEALLNEGLLLDAEPSDVPSAERQAATRISTVAPEVLADDRTLLRGVFGLLVGAHYQTRPSDLRQLLENPDLRFWLARRGDAVVAVALVVAEGGFDAAMAEQILSGRRRPRGHLLPQSLAVHAGLDACLVQRVWRVQRIAVHADARRQGLASHLLDAIGAGAGAEGVDLLGCAFGIEPDLLLFWRAAGFVPVRLGLRIDPASAGQSLFMLRGLSPRGQILARDGQAAFLDALPWALGGSLQGLDSRIAVLLLQGRDCSDIGLSAADAKVLRRIIANARQPASAEALLWKAVVHLAARRPVPIDRLAPLLAWLLQRQPQVHICRVFGLAGRPALERHLRTLLNEQITALVSTG